MTNVRSIKEHPRWRARFAHLPQLNVEYTAEEFLAWCKYYKKPRDYQRYVNSEEGIQDVLFYLMSAKRTEKNTQEITEWTNKLKLRLKNER